MNKTSTMEFDDHNSSPRCGCAIAIGNFDGFHLGHRKIIDTLIAIAQEKGLISMILTFSPNPRVYFKRESYLIHTDTQKRRILENTSVDRVCIIDFERVVNMTDEDFLTDILIDRFFMKHIVMGENFRFGRGRVGDIMFLKDVSVRYGFEFTVVPPVHLDNVRISSTVIRGLLVDGQIEQANRMLGRDYFIEGVVMEGDRRGRELGYPTINVNTGNTLLPEGVFQTLVEIDEQMYPSISYIGFRPTFQGKEKKVESHIFNFTHRIYGKMVRIHFQEKLRGDMTFNSRTQLIQQIKKDIEHLKCVDKGIVI